MRCSVEPLHVRADSRCFAQCDARGQRSLELHRDGSLLSFNVLLSHESEFEGGGTHFPDLAAQAAAGATDAPPHVGGTVHLRQGDACVHSGSALHAGAAVTAGVRVILVGFVESVRS